MSLRINDIAPNFKARTTQGETDFHEWIGGHYAVLFSHPKDFTPVCTTELGFIAKIEDEFTKRNAKLIGLSIDKDMPLVPYDNGTQFQCDFADIRFDSINYTT
jgi:alkyl hydroperoxide reductase subunit AhpC